MVELEVLGPLVVWAGGRQLRLGPALRVLLLCLLCADGELVLAGRLAGLLSETGYLRVALRPRSAVTSLICGARSATLPGRAETTGIPSS